MAFSPHREMTLMILMMSFFLVSIFEEILAHCQRNPGNQSNQHRISQRHQIQVVFVELNSCGYAIMVKNYAA